MHVAVDQAGRERDAMRVDRRRRAGKVEVWSAADRRDAAIDRDNRIRIENRLFEVAAEHEPNVPDHEFGRRAPKPPVRRGP